MTTLKNPQLNEWQRRAVEAIRAHGGKAIPSGGGFWHGADGERLNVEPVNTRIGRYWGGFIPTQTIYALEARGVLVRDDIDARRWKDSRSLVEPAP